VLHDEWGVRMAVERRGSTTVTRRILKGGAVASEVEGRVLALMHQVEEVEGGGGSAPGSWRHQPVRDGHGPTVWAILCGR
jgi:hypothetical protein